jgi:hypothetical protein
VYAIGVLEVGDSPQQVVLDDIIDIYLLLLVAFIFNLCVDVVECRA